MRSLAFLLSVLVHIGAALWISIPKDPTVMPDQSVMQITMLLQGADESRPKAQQTSETENVTKLLKDQESAKNIPVPDLPDPSVAIPTAVVKTDPDSGSVKPKKKPPNNDKPGKPLSAVKKSINSEFINSTNSFDTPVTQNQTRKGENRKTVITKAKPTVSANNPPPNYPPKAHQNGIQGTVLLTVLVQSNGRPRTVEVLRSSGYRILDIAALKAVRKWQFNPAYNDNIPVEAFVEVPVEFVLS